MANMPRIFVSHSHADNYWYAELVEALTLGGFDVWLDTQGFDAGDEWISKIETELEDRDVFLVVLMPESWASKWVRREVLLAIHQDKRILGVMLEPTDLSGFITTYQVLDAVGQQAQLFAEQISLTFGVALDMPSVAEEAWVDEWMALEESDAPEEEAEEGSVQQITEGKEEEWVKWAGWFE
jgi:hypothetical protein